jgi:hypothetical protein
MVEPALTTTVLSAGVGAVVGFLSAVGKNYLDARRKVDEDLRTRRSSPYQELWNKTQSFQLWPRREAFYSEVEEFQRQLASWYYDTGGMLLSNRGQRAYQRLQERLTPVIRVGREMTDDKRNMTSIPEKDLTAVEARCRRLRAALTDDLLSRRSGRRLF